MTSSLELNVALHRIWQKVKGTIETVSSVLLNTMEGQFSKENYFKTNLNFAPWPPATTWPLILHHYRWPGFKRCQPIKPATTSPSHLVAVPLQLELAGVQPPRGANLWKTLRPLKNVTMVNETEREGGRGRSKQIHYTALGSVKANFPDAKWDRMTGFWLRGDYFCLLLWKTVCVKTTCQWRKHNVMPVRPNSSRVSFL